MATPVDIRPERSELGTLITAYLSAAEAGWTLDRSGTPFSPAGLRSLRRALAHIEAAAVPLDRGTLERMDAPALERLGWRVVDQAGLPPSLIATIVDALRGLSAYAGRREAAPRREPAPWAEPPQRVEPPSRVARELAPAPSPPTAAPEARTPTFTMLALGAHISAWMQRIIVIAFVLTAIGLGLALL